VKAKVVHDKGEEGMEMTFSYTLKPGIGGKDVIYFAFTYPFTLEDITKSIDEV